MSFTTDTVSRLLELTVKKNCCRKALTLGLFSGARYDEEKGSYVSFFYEEKTANTAKELLSRVYHAEAEINETVRVGRRCFVLSFDCPAVAGFLRRVDEADRVEEYLKSLYKCELCRGVFLRGVFIACGSISDPEKGYHLEIAMPTEKRVDIIIESVSDFIDAPKKARRGGRVSFYLKSNSAIFYFLSFIGSHSAATKVFNGYVKRDMRNKSVRMANCDTSNISRTVGASQKHRIAIEKLILADALDDLGDELKATAALRMEHTSASLSELAALHNPPISKSVLNRRLMKLLDAADQIK